MSDEIIQDQLVEPQKHLIGFADTPGDCVEVIQALIDDGFPDSAITALGGDDGIEKIKLMLGGELWGETAEDVMKQSVIELSHGHYCLVIECEDRDRAMAAATLATRHGGHGFSHFGTLTDERLTR